MRQPEITAAPWCGAQKVITTMVIVLIAVGLAVLYGPGGLAASESALGRILALALILAIPAGPLFAVRGYVVTDGAIEVLRLGWRTRIPLRGLRSVESGPELLRGSLRLFGNGGFFSFTGLFWNRRLGRYRMFANDPRRAVALHFPDRRVVLAPADPETFASRLRRATGIVRSA